MRSVIVILFLLAITFCRASTAVPDNLKLEITTQGWLVSTEDLARLQASGCIMTFDDSFEPFKPHPVFNFLRKKQRSGRKLTAAVLAFPFPFGIVGLHRIFLGTAPYVPIVYIATAGGVFGLLPLIDFIAIVAEKDLARFSGNRQVFMWVE
jgi:TM2 domain-containing membrane protein YozV